MDIIDPRIFLILPEHISNANHLWNCALFLTQISNIESILSSTYRPLDQQQSQQTGTDSTNNEQTSSDSINSTNSTQTLTENCLMMQLNETIMRIYKIKKRNKASLLNLILPFDFSKPKKVLNQQSTKSLASSTPWLDNTISNESNSSYFLNDEGCKR